MDSQHDKITDEQIELAATSGDNRRPRYARHAERICRIIVQRFNEHHVGPGDQQTQRELVADVHPSLVDYVDGRGLTIGAHGVSPAPDGHGGEEWVIVG